jgi:plastocyanin
MKLRALLLLLAACSGLLLPPAATASNHVILMTNFAFIPGSLSVAAGDSLIWTNTTTTQHDTVASGGAWTSQLFGLGKSYESTLTASGFYPYECSIHTLENMSGSVTVTNQLPKVAIVSPLSGAVYKSPASIVIEATASSVGGTIKQTRILESTNLLGAASGSSYSYRVGGLTNGVYTFYAEAIDDATNSSFSAPVVISVTTVQLLAPALNPDGAFQCSVAGFVAGKTNLIEASTDMRKWLPVATNTPSFRDAGTTAYPFRFYRAVVEP